MCKNLPQVFNLREVYIQVNLKTAKEERMEEYDIDDVILMAAASDVGTVRKKNEDYFYYSEKGKFFIVCDGMGGHKAGGLASRIAGETVRDVLLDDSIVDLARACEDIDNKLPIPALKLIASVRLANRRIALEAVRNSDNRGMGSTIVVALLHDKWLFTINVGDSRIYRLRKTQLSILTKDHTWINELIEDKEINEKDIQKFSKKNVLTRALGIYPTVKIDLKIENIEKNDLYLLCSDGLHNALSEELITSVLSAKHKTIQKMIDKLVLSAKQLNGSDNITGGVFYINNSTNGKAAPTFFEKTIVDEPEKVTVYLDRTLKTLYPVPKALLDQSTKWMAIGGAAIILIIIMSLFFYRSGKSEKISSETLASALLTQELSTISHISQDTQTSKTEKAGTLVLLQLKDEKYLKFLQTLNDVRILDHVRRFNSRLPIYAGNFTWAVADSAKKIIYQKNNLKLRAISRWAYTQPAPAFFDSGIISDSRPVGNNSNQNHGIIYIVGSFEGNDYRNAEIYIDNRRLGSLNSYLESGFSLRPGNYTISIRDTNGNILKSRSNQLISNGEIIAVEF
jgi:protein phosphatase